MKTPQYEKVAAGSSGVYCFSGASLAPGTKEGRLNPLSSHPLDEIKVLAEAAGREILRIYRGGTWKVHAKADESPLTEADLAANEIIVPGLLNLTGETIVSEESDPTAIIAGEKFWLVDPLDGTRDFVARLDTFVICIARVVNREPVFGLIHSPLTKETWWAEAGRGAYGPHGERLSVAHGREPLIALGSRTVASPRMQGFYDHFGIKEVTRMGSALKFCKLAAGEADLYPRFGPTSEWDTAAGQIIVEEAGGRVLDISTGQRLAYGKPKFVNAGGFMAARADLDVLGRLS